MDKAAPGIGPALAPGVTVVVCCYNSAEVIAPTLRSLAGQEVPAGSGYEVILVDNLCRDDTVRRAQEVWQGGGARHPLRIVEESEPGLIHARKKGVSQARYDILLFVDDDNLLSPGGIATLLSLYRDHKRTVGIGGRVEPRFEGEKPPWFDLACGTFACSPTGPESGLPGTRTVMSGAGLSFRTRCLLSLFRSSVPLFLVGRKGEALSRGEDAEICLRVLLQGGELRYEPALRLKHFLRKDRLNWDYVLSARRWYGKADAILSIYKDLLAGSVPPPFSERLADAERRWEKIRLTIGAAPDEANNEGSRHALKRNYFQGLLEGLRELGNVGYDGVREEIMAAHPAGGEKISQPSDPTARRLELE